MGNIKYTMDELAEQFSVIPGMKEFFGLIATPDEIFDLLYPELKKALEEQIGAPETVALLQDVRNTPEYQQASDNIPILIESFKNIEGISQNKISFLTTLFTMFLEPFDVEIAIEFLPGAVAPHYVHDTDAGMDIYANEDILIPAGARGVVVKTGLKCAIPEGWQLAIRPRSGMSKKTPIRISNCVGTIDSGYRDEIGVLVDNLSDSDYTIANGDRIAQFVVEKVYKAKWKTVEDVTTIGGNRNGGFGSTGN
jgi:dUTP pyrophosphatase